MAFKYCLCALIFLNVIFAITLMNHLSMQPTTSFAQSIQPSVNCTPVGFGLSGPTELCTPDNVCTALLTKYSSMGITSISSPMFEEYQCAGWIKNPVTQKYANYFDSALPKPIAIPASVPLSQDPYTRNRVYCEFIPSNASSTNQVPLVIMVHGSGGNASSNIYGATLWRYFAQENNFALIATQAMNRHWPASGVLGPTEDGSKNDYFYRHVGANDDFAYFDTLIDSLVATGKINKRRIYISGWSNGNGFATLYALLRSGSTDGGGLSASDVNKDFVFGHTPVGKNQIAAMAAFSGPDPFIAPGWNLDCITSTYPKSTLPILQVSRLCDLVSCASVGRFVDALQNQVGSQNATWIFVDYDGNVLDHGDCAARYATECNDALNAAGHTRWCIEQMPEMLSFLWRYELPLNPTSTLLSSGTSSSSTSSVPSSTTSSTSISTTSTSQQTSAASSTSSSTSTSSIPSTTTITPTSTSSTSTSSTNPSSSSASSSNPPPTSTTTITSTTTVSSSTTSNSSNNGNSSSAAGEAPSTSSPLTPPETIGVVVAVIVGVVIVAAVFYKIYKNRQELADDRIMEKQGQLWNDLQGNENQPFQPSHQHGNRQELNLVDI